jgi:ribonuclease T1
MAASASAGRQRYRLLLLLVAAVALVVWFFTPAGQDDPSPSSTGATTTEPSTEPSTEPGAEPTTFPSTPPASEGTDPDSGLPLVRVSDLPPEAAETLELIDAGGPFPEPDHDGGTFQNREELLPDRPMGYYAEYTVPTPGSDDRGARRIVAGDDGELYWTGDHYSSFSRIVRSR